MLISRYELQVAPDFEITRTATGVDLTFFYGLSGSYDPDTELYYWDGEIIADLGDDQGYVYQNVDRPMDMSFSATLEDGVTEYGHYELSDYGDRGAYMNFDFAVTTYSSAADHQASGRTAHFVFGSDEADRISGARGGDVFEGGGGADSLIGGSGNDQLLGGAHADVLNGGVGDDTLSGGTGADRLQGGLGMDELRGGGGADQFLFRTALGAANADAIRDFVSGQDEILLDDAVFAGIGAPGGLADGVFAAVPGGAATDPSQRILYDAASGRLFFDADGSGAGEALLFAQLRPNAALTEDDFRVV